MRNRRRNNQRNDQMPAALVRSMGMTLCDKGDEFLRSRGYSALNESDVGELAVHRLFATSIFLRLPSECMHVDTPPYMKEVEAGVFHFVNLHIDYTPEAKWKIRGFEVTRKEPDPGACAIMSSYRFEGGLREVTLDKVVAGIGNEPLHELLRGEGRNTPKPTTPASQPEHP